MALFQWMLVLLGWSTVVCLATSSVTPRITAPLDDPRQTLSLSCAALTPQLNATANRLAITHCLASVGVANLTGDRFPIDDGIALPPHAILTGHAATTATTLLLSAQALSTNFVVSMGSHATVSNLILSANGGLPAGCCSAVVVFGDSVVESHVLSCDIVGQQLPPATAVYFIGTTARDNTVEQCNISSSHYGVIFVAGLAATSNNVVTQCRLFNHACDSVTFAGFGVVALSHVHDNGWNCMNGNPPIPGGGFYCLGNTVGGVVRGNKIHDNCGMLLDIDTCTNFNVSENHAYNPGNTWNGAYPYCVGSLAVNLIDSSSFTITNNLFENTRSTNAVGLGYFGDANGVFGNIGAPPFSDLPNGANTVVAFSIVTRHTVLRSTGNVVSGNTFHGDCSTEGCAGVGYFAGRGTGWNGGAWAPSLYTLNCPYGSDVGSKRCGGNWYAGNTPVCPQVDPPSPCNEDDYQHPDVVNWRNDAGCATYTTP